MEKFGVYVIITKPELPYAVIAEKCVKSGVRMLQLREKHLTDDELITIGKTLRAITKGTFTSLVINDRPDIAMLCDADYLHLGQDDMDIDDARKIVGNMKIGLSTHTIYQAKKALEKNPAYIGFGPVYSTNAKANPDQPVGPDKLGEVMSFADVPVVAIGGLFPDNLQPVIDAGAKNIAMVRYLMQTKDFEKRVAALSEKIK